MHFSLMNIKQISVTWLWNEANEANDPKKKKKKKIQIQNAEHLAFSTNTHIPIAR